MSQVFWCTRVQELAVPISSMPYGSIRADQIMSESKYFFSVILKSSLKCDLGVLAFCFRVAREGGGEAG